MLDIHRTMKKLPPIVTLPHSVPAAGTAVARVPRYASLAAALTGDISSGRYKVGGAIPTEKELCNMYGCGRHTVRQALNKLKEQGLISSHAGIGTLVRGLPDSPKFLNEISTVAELLQFASSTRMHVVSRRKLVTDEAHATLLHCYPGEKWNLISYLRKVPADRLPMGFCMVYIREEYAAAVAGIKTVEGSISALLEKHTGVRINEIQQEITASHLPAPIAESVLAKPGQAALKITRHFLDVDGKMIQVSIGYYPCDRYRHVSQFKARKPGVSIA